MDIKKLTILLVDDEPDLLQICRAYLEACGHEVHTFDSGKAASEKIGEGIGFDLVITDINMSPMTGIELAEFCLNRRPGTPIILTSGQAKQDFSSVVFEHRDVQFIEKPVSRNDLESAFAQFQALDCQNARSEP